MVPSPNSEHQRVAGRLFRLLADHVEKHGLGELFIVPLDVILSPNSAPQPDLLFVSASHAGRVASRGIEGAPDLVIEILSPSSKNKDWVRKQRVYAKHGVPEYWVLDPQTRSISVLVLEEDGYEPRDDATGESPIPSRIFPDLPFLPRDVFEGPAQG